MYRAKSSNKRYGSLRRRRIVASGAAVLSKAKCPDAASPAGVATATLQGMRWRLPSPLGPLLLEQEGEALTRLRIEGRGAAPGETPGETPGEAPTALLREAARQLAAYFARERRDFALPLAPAGGGPFERQVWQALTEIPYGATETYGSLARRVGGVARAVGQACGANPLPIVIPCHRVLAAGGSGGFSAPGGVDTKYRLLALEGAALL